MMIYMMKIKFKNYLFIYLLIMGNLCVKMDISEKPEDIQYFVYDLQNNEYEYNKIRWNEKIFIKEFT